VDESLVAASAEQGSAAKISPDEGAAAAEQPVVELGPQPESAMNDSLADARERQPSSSADRGELNGDASSEDSLPSGGEDRRPEAAPDSEDRPPRPVEPAGPFVEDGRSDQALDFVVDVLTAMGMDCTVDLMENTDEDPASDIRIEINGKDSEGVVGKKGQTLAAMQFLVNRVVNRPQLPRRHILIDAGGYRTRREAALSAMALRLGQQAVKEGKIITFEPMSAQDRRVVHLALAKFVGVVTKSEGKGATRRVQIIPVRE